MTTIPYTNDKTLRIFENIMEGYPEWFIKDEDNYASLEFRRGHRENDIYTLKLRSMAHSLVTTLVFSDIDDALGYLESNRFFNVLRKPECE